MAGGKEGGNAGRVPLNPSAFGEKPQRDLLGKAFAIGAIGGHGTVGIGDCHQTCEEWDFEAGKAVRIAAAVPALVMVTNRFQGPLQARHGGNDHRAHNRVMLDDLDLFLRERRRFTQDEVRDTDLTDIVQQRRRRQIILQRLIHPHLRRNLNTIAHDIFRVAARIAVFVVDRRNQRVKHGKTIHGIGQVFAELLGLVCLISPGLGPKQARVRKFQGGETAYFVIGKDRDTDGQAQRNGRRAVRGEIFC